MFFLGQGALPRHPGIAAIQEIVSRPGGRIIGLVWSMLGGTNGTKGLRAVLERHLKFEDGCALVILPLYSDDGDLMALHHLMECLTAARMAKRYYTGRRLFGMFSKDWPEVEKFNLKTSGSVRVYKMTHTEYLSMVLEVLGSGPWSGENPPGAQQTPNDVGDGPNADNVQPFQRRDTAA